VNQIGVPTRTARLSTPRGEFAAAVTVPKGRSSKGIVLALPGFTGSKEDFALVGSPLAARGWHVVALDQRGQYETPGPDDPAAYTVDALARDAIAVADVVAGKDPHVGHPVHLVGHSFGGLVARQAVLTRPQRWASLTLLDSGPGPVPAAAWPGLLRTRELLMTTSLDQVWVRRRRRQLAAGAPVFAPDVEAFLQARFCRHSPACLSAMAEQLMSAPDRTEDLAHTTTAAHLPVLVVWGEHDDAWPVSEQRQMADRLTAQAVQLPNAGHTPTVDAPDQLAIVLDQFWSAASTAEARSPR
jgi:pimeloyl-ACP methyl ester carboxylesterase